MNIEKRLRRLTMLGITDFVTTKDAQALQTDMLSRLKRSKIDPGQYASLTDCQSNHCAYKKCLEACWFGTRQRPTAGDPGHPSSPAKQQETVVRSSVCPEYVGAAGETSPLRSHYRCKEVERPGA
jgi:hypothetical protein